MKKATSAIALACTVLFCSTGFAQSVNNSSAPNTATTADGVTPTPDATNTRPQSNMSGTMKHRSKHKKTHHMTSSGSSSTMNSDTGTGSTSGQGSTMQRTPDGVTPTPDATIPAK
jgi:hypothetical protein